MSSEFNSEQSDFMDRVWFLQREIKRCDFARYDCPLLAGQIQEAEVLVSRMEDALRDLRQSLRSEKA